MSHGAIRAAQAAGASNWFHDLTGFSESAGAIKKNLTLEGTTLHSKANGRSFQVGQLRTPSLGELRTACDTVDLPAGQLRVTEVLADAGALHADPANAGAFFQVASQFNLLEMVSPSVLPESGVTQYQGDKTQGPACAMACGAGTIFRNWLVEVNGKPGQRKKRQLDMLADVGADLDNRNDRLWKMRNGYALATGSGLTDLPEVHDQLRIGIQANTEVTLGDAGHLVTQAYCSALPVAYTSGVSTTALEPLARMILNSSYEATIAAARLHHAAGGSPLVYLTLIGGGVFGNETAWIVHAMQRTFAIHHDAPLDVRIVSYRASNPDIASVLTG
jgi:hypothetical protein